MRILLVEDEPDMGATIKEILNREKYVVDWVQDGTEAWEYIQDRLADYSLAIFDWLVPGLSGLELCRRLRNRKNPLPILILTAKDKIEDRVTGLDAGADDYLVKPFSIPELLARVRALQRRSPLLQTQKLQVDGLILDCGARTAHWQSSDGKVREISLTNKEFQVLEYLMKYPRQVIQSDRIRRQIWEIDAYNYSNVVAAQVRLVRRKLESIGCGKIIETVPGQGYRFNPKP
ncbi:response regulator with CheY-like receiver domain and winged-helix DNA-binding domain [Xenococcus sp. PCC 7305]|uniref:two-component system response regulator RppA n=1 Tax=Xenococcus sp. PCC 7305 TaxID=102125 RepID=UPI0002ABF4E9|nr:two-component system response regulator RppA [Xenococcus sp. PCC 7305]ELS02913.1 response regulator with CheY-like receiver domain and winged-helix DNA-binding domain [Xenococcus sp. PCC 7305]